MQHANERRAQGVQFANPRVKGLIWLGSIEAGTYHRIW